MKAVVDSHAMDEDEVDEVDEEHNTDEDEALQEALASGKLKPGLYGQFARTEAQAGKLDKEGLEHAMQSTKLNLGWIERLDIVGGLAPLSRSAYEAVGVDFDEAAVRELEQLEEALSGQEKDTQEADAAKSEVSEAKRKRTAKLRVKRAERSMVANDFVREMHFYRQAQAAALTGLQKLHEAGVETRRPADYFAEMAKSDVHMQRVRDRLLQLENRLAMAEKAKRIRDARKFAKEAERERAAQSKAATNRLDALVDSVRSGKRNTADLERELATETSRSKHQAGLRAPASKKPKRDRDSGAHAKPNNANDNRREQSKRPDGPSKSQPRRNKRREKKDAQYGFGGQKKRGKWNTKDSNEDVDRSFSKWRSNGNASKFKKSKKGGAQRPGKRSRQRMHNKQG